MPKINQNILYKNLFKNFIPTVVEATKNAGGRWPMPIFEDSTMVGYYSSEIIIKKFLSLTNLLLKNGISLKEIGKRYKYPSKFARILHVFSSRAVWSLPNKTIKLLANRIAAILYSMYRSHHFCQNGKNIFYPQKCINSKYLKYYKNSKINNPQVQNSILKITRLFYLLVESFSPRFPNFFYEYSGPYKIKNRYVIIKDFHDLQPKHIKIKPNYSFSDVTVWEVYNKNVNFKVDIMCRPSASNLKLASPQYRLIFIDGTLVTNNKLLLKYLKQINITLVRTTNFLSTLTTKEQMVSYNSKIEGFGFIFPLSEKDAADIPKLALKNFKNPQFQKKVEKAKKWFRSVPKTPQGWATIFNAKITPKIK